jgi:Tol biopolymer transport system component
MNAISNGTFNIDTYSLDSTHAEHVISASPTATEVLARFSPDGKWVAYQSNESGRFEVYLRSFPGNSTRVQVSADGGVKPIWSRDGSRIYYWNQRTMMMATLARDTEPRVVSRQALFDGDYLQDFDVSSDGSKLLMVQTQPGNTELIVVPDWATELKAKTR